MPDPQNISGFPTLDVEDLDQDQDFVLFVRDPMPCLDPSQDWTISVYSEGLPEDSQNNFRAVDEDIIHSITVKYKDGVEVHADSQFSGERTFEIQRVQTSSPIEGYQTSSVICGRVATYDSTNNFGYYEDPELVFGLFVDHDTLEINLMSGENNYVIGTFNEKYKNRAASAVSANLLSKSSINKSPKYFLKNLKLTQPSLRQDINFKTYFEYPNLLHTKSKFICKVDFIVDFNKEYVQKNDSLEFIRLLDLVSPPEDAEEPDPLSADFLNDTIIQQETILLPSLYIYKNYQSNNIYLSSANSYTMIDNLGTKKIFMSRVFCNNQYYSINCILKTSDNSILFERVSYARGQFFPTQINFTVESFASS